MTILLVIVVIDYIAKTNTNTRINTINKMMMANVITKINTRLCIVDINSRSNNNTNIDKTLNNMSINTIIVQVNIIQINLLV